jgi:hypothetical protein
LATSQRRCPPMRSQACTRSCRHCAGWRWVDRPEYSRTAAASAVTPAEACCTMARN